MLTAIHKQKFTHLFHVMDADRNGLLEWADYERIAVRIAAVRGYVPGTPVFEQLLGPFRYGWEQAAPFANENTLNLEQWLDSYDAVLRAPAIYEGVVRPAAGLIFDALDLDADEMVTVREWREFFHCYSIDPTEADGCFYKYDLDGDGFVTRSEFVNLVAQFYLSSDPSAPGNYLFGAFAQEVLHASHPA
jgi:juvenile hormone diol kinase